MSKTFALRAMLAGLVATMPDADRGKHRNAPKNHKSAKRRRHAAVRRALAKQGRRAARKGRR